MLAHKNNENTQTLKAHSDNVATYVSNCMESCQLSYTALLVGIIHDMGKCKEEFQYYLDSDNAVKGAVNHSFAAFRYIIETFRKGEEPIENLTAEIIAYTAAAHHGLFDCLDPQQKSGMIHRLTKEVHYEESKINFLKIYSECDLESIFNSSVSEIENVVQQLKQLSDSEELIQNQEFAFYISLLIRLLLSALIDGDRTDTAQFFGVEKENNLINDWKPTLHYLENKLQEFPKDTPINQARHWINHQCKESANKEPGIYRLHAPTGGGKTLGSLYYSLIHAEKYRKKRIIIVEPLLSIIDQNADVIRNFINDPALLLEHHSDALNLECDSKSIKNQRELAIENWDSPIIITTLAQFLLTLYSGRTSDIRRFHALQDAVIIIDEAQTVPVKMLTLFNLAMNFLAEICNATIILCSATQPCFNELTHPLKQIKGEIIPYNQAVWDIFNRTKIVDKGNMRFDDIEGVAMTVLNDNQSLLIVCNKKSQARMLYQALKSEDNACYHLSAGMCMDHRKKVIEDMRKALKNGKRKVLCIATQVIEAGVDISFQAIIRFQAGLDHIVQTAGRCNRNGELDGLGIVYLVNCIDEKLVFNQEIKKEKIATEIVKKQCSENDDLFSIVQIEKYFKYLYRQLYFKDFADYPVKRTSIFSMMALNEQYASNDIPHCRHFFLNQSLKTAGNTFQVYDNDAINVIVPYGEGKKLIEQIVSSKKKLTLSDLKRINKAAKPFTIGLYDYELEKNIKYIKQVDGFYVLMPEIYSEEFGFNSI